MEHQRTFGQWIRQYREDKGIDLRSIARSAQLNASTISRIERGIIDPTLMTAVRISQALDADPADFYSFLSGKPHDSLIWPENEELEVLTIEDVVGFEMLVTKNPMVVERALADKLNQIQRALPETTHFPDTSPYTFNSDDVFRLLSGSPLYRINLQYPNFISAQSILDIFRRGGLIIRKDILAYISKKHIDKNLQIKLGSEEAKITTIQNSSLVGESKRKVKLSEIIRVDKILGDKGEILIMSWKALKFEREARLNPPPSIDLPEPLIGWWNLQCMKYGYMLILMSRWIEYLNHPESEWLNEIRSQIDSEVKEE